MKQLTSWKIAVGLSCMAAAFGACHIVRAEDPPNTVVPIAPPPPQPVVRSTTVFHDVEGEVEYRASGSELLASGFVKLKFNPEAKWEKAKEGQDVGYGPQVRTGKDAAATLETGRDGEIVNRIQIGAQSEISVGASSVRLRRGTVSVSAPKTQSTLHWGRVNAVVHSESVGAARVTDDGSLDLQVDRGTVNVRIADKYKVKLTAGHAIIIKADDSAPTVREVTPK